MEETAAMPVEEVIEAYRRHGEKKSFARKLEKRIRQMRCSLCNNHIAGKQWEVVLDAVMCVDCTHDIGGD